MNLVLHTDGGSRGNPGGSACAWVLWDADTLECIGNDGIDLGIATNNMAEYNGLYQGLEHVVQHYPDVSLLMVRMDSQLIVRQMEGRWKVGDELSAYHKMAMWRVDFLRNRGCDVTFEWVPRSQNKEADRICNEVMDACGY